MGLLSQSVKDQSYQSWFFYLSQSSIGVNFLHAVLMLVFVLQSVNINLDIQRVVGYRHWCNKLWNVIRFAMMNLGSDFVPSQQLDMASLPFGCKWILAVLNSTVEKTVNSFEALNLSEASTAMYSWWLYQLCDVFIEISKPALNGDDTDPAAAQAKKATRDTLWVCLDIGLRLLHPIMPFLTEELWQRLPRRQEDDVKSSIMISPYPSVVEVRRFTYIYEFSRL